MRFFPRDRDLSRPVESVELPVRASDFGLRPDELELRLDHFLARRMEWRSRTSIQDLIKDGFVAVEGATPDHPRGTGKLATELRPGRKLRDSFRVVVTIPEELRIPMAERAVGVDPLDPGALGELRVLYRDECALAVDKPPMLPVHPAGRHLTGTLIQRLHALLGTDQLERAVRPRLCHRLDRETSGIVLVGMDPWSHTRIMRQFESRSVEKEYLAIVRGVPKEDGGRIELAMGPARGSKIGLKMMVDLERGQEAATQWRVVERFARCTLVACQLITGRTHQIRVHMQAIGFPVIGDKLYGSDEMLFQKGADGSLTESDQRLLELPRHALHSHKLVFTSPRSEKRVTVESPLASDLQEYLSRQTKQSEPVPDLSRH